MPRVLLLQYHAHNAGLCCTCAPPCCACACACACAPPATSATSTPPNPRPRHAANKVALPHWRPKHSHISSHVRPVLGRLSRQLLFLRFLSYLSLRLIQTSLTKAPDRRFPDPSPFSLRAGSQRRPRTSQPARWVRLCPPSPDRYPLLPPVSLSRRQRLASIVAEAQGPRCPNRRHAAPVHNPRQIRPPWLGRLMSRN